MKAIDFSYFIERYNASEMDEEEEKWFKKEMEGNEDLHDEVELRKKTDMVLKEKDIMSLRNKLNVIEKQRENPASSVKFQKFHNIRNVAVLAGIVLLAGIALLSRGKPGNDEIIRRYYKPYEVVMISRSVNSATARDNFQHAVGYYHIKDYRNAAIYFNKVLDSIPGDMHTELLNGISNFEIQNYPEAKASFSKVIEDNNNLYIDHAQWYLALCFIKTGEIEKAVCQLREILDSRTIYRKDVRKILRYLNR